MANSGLNLVPYTIASFGTLLVYDYLCTFADEIALVWSQPMRVSTILFLLNRYPPLVDTFMSLFLLTTAQTPETCTHVFKGITWLIVLGVLTAETILMLRTYAIYDRKRWVLILLVVVFACVVIPSIIVVQMELNSLSYGYPLSGPYTGCTFTKPASAIIFIAYVLVVFSETIVVGLTLYKAIYHLRQSNAPLVVNLYRNGLMFYGYILAISLANVIVPVTVHSGSLYNWLATPQRVLHSIFCNRILLSIILHSRYGQTSVYGPSITNSRLDFTNPNAHSRHHGSQGLDVTSVPESSAPGTDSMFNGSHPSSHPPSSERTHGHTRSEWDGGGLRVYTSFAHEEDEGMQSDAAGYESGANRDIPLQDMSRSVIVGPQKKHVHDSVDDLDVVVEARDVGHHPV